MELPDSHLALNTRHSPTSLSPFLWYDLLKVYPSSSTCGLFLLAGRVRLPLVTAPNEHLREPNLANQRFASVTRKQRFQSLLHLPLAILLIAICCTPLMYWPPFFRAWLYSVFCMSKVFAAGGYPSAATRSIGLAIWDWIHPHSTLVASALLPVGIPLFLWFWLDLKSEWGGTLGNKIGAVQLITAAAVGSVAILIFLSFQLQRMLTPRVHACFLPSDTSSESQGHQFFERYEYRQTFKAKRGAWIHIRITNVSPIDYASLDVSCELPPNWLGSSATRRDWDMIEVRADPRCATESIVRSKPEWLRPYVFRPSQRRFHFGKVDDPKDTGPGASSVWSFYAEPGEVAAVTSETIRVFVRSSQSGGTTTKRLSAVITPTTSTP
jgi:hypothetical protein